jgi:hypothetical protein
MSRAPHPDSDNAWKDALTRYSREFTAFFFPAIHAEVDWRRGYEFLDKELAQVMRDAATGRRLADKLVKVHLADGSEKWLLVHVEVQGARSAGFALRMYTYNYRLFDQHWREVVSLAVMTEGRGAAVGRYAAGRWGCELDFKFPTVWLGDWEARWVELEAEPSPFAVIVMAQLKARASRRDVRARREWKRRLLYSLYERGYRREDVRALFRFIDFVIALPPAAEQKLRQEIYEYEEGQKMPYISSWERMSREEGLQKGLQEGLQRGLQQGLQQGQIEGKREVVTMLLRQRLGNLSQAAERRIQKLTLAQLNKLALALMKFETHADLNRWLKSAA